MKKYPLLLFGAFLFFLSSCTFDTTDQKNTTTYDYYLYFSTTMDNYLTSGRLIGVGAKDQVLLKTSGLELGGFTQLDQQLHCSDRQYDYIYTPKTGKIKKVKRATKEHTGIKTMAIEETVIKLFNHGYSENGQYHTHIYMNQKNYLIKEYIYIVGNDLNNIYTLGETDLNELSLSRHYFHQDELISEFIGTFPNSERESYHFSYYLAVYHNNLYSVVFDLSSGNPYLFQYSLTDHMHNLKNLASEIKFEDVGFFSANGSFIYKDQLVYFSGNNTIYFIDLETAQINKKYYTDIDLTGHFFIDSIDGQMIAIANYNAEHNIDIWTLDLATFKEKKERTIDTSLWRSNEYLYDFQVSK